MRRLIFVVAVVLVLGVLAYGCGNREKKVAMQKWATFEAQQIAAIMEGYGQAGLASSDFSSHTVEVKDAPYQFLGYVSFKKGNTFLEKSFAFVDGNWEEVDYAEAGDPKALEHREEQVKKLKKRIRYLDTDILDVQRDLKRHKHEVDKLVNKQAELQSLQDQLQALTKKEPAK